MPAWICRVRGRPLPALVDVAVIELDQAPDGYAEFDAGVPKKFVIDPHGSLAAAA